MPFREAAATWARIGIASFGGPAAQIALMHRVLVREKGWLDESRFLHALNFCMLLPGPEAQQLATYVGWLLHRVRGGLAAGLLFILPGAVVMAALAAGYAAWGNVPAVAAAFAGVKAAVLAIVADALIRIGRRALKDGRAYALAAGAFTAIFLFDLPFPLIVAAAGLIGCLRRGTAAAEVGTGGGPGLAWRPAVIALAAWMLPVAALSAILGTSHVLSETAWFFSRMAVVTFGGAYAVLSYVAQEAVATYGWLAPGEMLDALGLAETTPGPLILVVEFVGFLASWRDPGGLDPLLAGLIGAGLTLWVTFAPCFLFIFAAAPHVERLRGLPRISGALEAVTAAVVGVILNLAVWFAVNALFRDVPKESWGPVSVHLPDPASIDIGAVGLALLAGLAMFVLRLGLMPTLGVSAAAGLGLHFAAA